MWHAWAQRPRLPLGLIPRQAISDVGTINLKEAPQLLLGRVLIRLARHAAILHRASRHSHTHSAIHTSHPSTREARPPDTARRRSAA